MKKGKKWKKFEAFCILLIVTLLLIFVRILYQPGTESERGELYTFSNGWYQLKDGKKTELKLPCFVTADKDGQIILYNDMLSEADKGKILSIRGIQDQLEVCIGDRLLYQYKDNRFEKNRQMKGKIWADISLPEKIGQEVLSISYETKKNARLYVYAPMIGEFCFIFRQHLLGSIFSILVVLGMTGLGIVSVIVFFYTRYRQIVEKRFLNVALFLLLCSLWCILDSGIYQMYGSQSAAGTLVSFYAFMTMSVPMLLFIQNTVSESVRWIPQVWIFLLYANAVLQGFLYFLFRIPFIDMLFITHLLLFTGVVSMILLLWKEYRKTQEKEVNLCLKAFGVLGISGVIALVLYWVLSIYWYESIFQFGILLYIAVLFWGLLCKVSNNIQFCLEQEVYRRMSLEDRMTDMKNRKSFEMYLEEIQEGAILLENVLLLFVKIAELKKINDMSGRQMGDETVIRTARSIQSAERSVLEQQAVSFRVDGGEFAIIVKNPQKTPEEWEHFIKEEMKEECGNRQPVRLKFGYSYLRKKNGSLLSFSDWKQQADDMLCSNK
ncbi:MULTISPECIES: sensor domain-containing diguanylate cyclase [unclassified Coprococcus]|uniref:sensor domain-containing diguanylate cyclase n=1 Tax=unclassified Coprococcus TaxID=2684943 RepID=UPI0022E66266|nr:MULTISPECIES: diguanylate cyclase [unclassified Coprococcus]